MPAAARLGDKAKGTCAHACPVCPHIVGGRAIMGAARVKINFQPALRKTDTGIHEVFCCGPNIWHVAEGSATVFIEFIRAARLGDPVRHCLGAGTGRIVSGSPNVFIGG